MAVNGPKFLDNNYRILEVNEVQAGFWSAQHVFTDHVLSFHMIKDYIMHKEHMSVVTRLLTVPKVPIKKFSYQFLMYKPVPNLDSGV